MTSYFAYLFPQIAGFLSPWLFVLAAAGSAGVSLLLFGLYERYTPDPAWTQQDEQYWWSITNPDGTPRPAYTALKGLFGSST